MINNNTTSTDEKVFIPYDEIIYLHMIAKVLESHKEYSSVAAKVRNCADELSLLSKFHRD